MNRSSPVRVCFSTIIIVLEYPVGGGPVFNGGAVAVLLLTELIGLMDVGWPPKKTRILFNHGHAPSGFVVFEN